jgi:hypothetical protein
MIYKGNELLESGRVIGNAVLVTPELLSRTNDIQEENE